LLPDYQNLCLKCTQWLRRDVAAGTDINEQLINVTALIRGLNVF